MVADWLRSEGFEPASAASVERLAEELKSRTFDVLLADVSFVLRDGIQSAARACNPRAPLIALGDGDPATEDRVTRRGATVVARPLDRATLVCSVTMAVMETRPVRRSVRKRVSRYGALVDGVPAHLIDVSNEGLRLEVPRGRRGAPPPYFDVRVPMLGLALIVRRMWSSSAPEPSSGATWYGGELTRNPPRVERAWRSFVDAIPSSGAVMEVR